MKNYRFLIRPAYFATLAHMIAAAKPGERVVVATMDIDPLETAIAEILDALHQAARRGARVTLLIDAHNFLQADNGLPGPLFYRQSLEKLRGKFYATMQALRALEAAGGEFVITNIPGRRFNLAPFGRSHIKGAVVGNQVFIGGCNLERPEHYDVMVAWQDSAAADTLANWLQRIASTTQTRRALGEVDSEVSIDAHTSLLIDAGVPGQSLIYDTALQLIDNAKEWLYMTCQYFPGGPTAKHLAAAQARGVRVAIDYSHPRAHGSGALLHHVHQISQRSRSLPSSLFTGRLHKSSPKLHAKVLVSEHEALVGSHNYVVQGVQFGTAELALHSSDPAFSRQLRSFMHEQLASRPPAARNPKENARK